jgi:hypothetical protein
MNTWGRWGRMPRGKGRTTRPISFSFSIQIADEFERFCREYKIIDRNRFVEEALMFVMKQYKEILRQRQIENTKIELNPEIIEMKRRIHEKTVNAYICQIEKSIRWIEEVNLEAITTRDEALDMKAQIDSLVVDTFERITKKGDAILEDPRIRDKMSELDRLADRKKSEIDSFIERLLRYDMPKHGHIKEASETRVYEYDGRYGIPPSQGEEKLEKDKKSKYLNRAD